jgi:hypothetical protein
MSFDLQAIVEDEPYWRKLVDKYGNLITKEGWEGPMEPADLENDKNWDALANFFSIHLSDLATEEAFEESDGEGIPGSADFASILNLEGKYFVTGSYLNGGPYESYEAAADEAGLGG